MADRTETKNVFLNRNYRLAFLGALVSDLGATFYSFAVSFYILEISGNNAFLQGLYLAACGAALLVAMPFGGVLGDRFNKARIMSCCNMIRGFLIIAASGLIALFHGPSARIAVLFAVGITENIISGIFSPASDALYPCIVEEEQLQQASAYSSIMSSFLSILAIMIAGVLYSLVPVSVLFCLAGACCVISGISEFFIRYEHKAPEEALAVRIVFSEMKDGIVYLKTQKAIMTFMTAVLFINFFFAPISGNFIPYFIEKDLAEAGSYLFDSALSPEMWSSVFSILILISSLAGSAILSAVKQEDRVGRKLATRLCILAGVTAAISFGYWFFVDSGRSIDAFLVLISVCLVLIGLLVSFINIPSGTAMIKMIDKDKLSKVTSLSGTLSRGLIPVASVLAGAVIQNMGCTPLLAVCTAGFAAAAVFLLMSRETDNI